MKDKFIRFLKNHRAWDEFKREIENYNNTLRGQYKSQTPVDDALAQLDWGKQHLYTNVLEDGICFFYDDLVTDIDWDDLDKQWKGEARS